MCLYFAKTRMRAKDLMWYPLKDLLEQLQVEATFNETELRCTIKRTGSMYQLSGAADLGEIEKWRGQSFNEVQVDECASHSLELIKVLVYRIVGPRLGDRDGCIGLGGSPGHILDGLFYDVTRPASDQHLPWKDRDAPDRRAFRGYSSHAWALPDIVGLPNATRKYPALVKLWAEALEEKERNKWSDDNPIWLREYMGQWAADDTENIYRYRAHLNGEPWNEWDPEYALRGDLRIAKLPAGRTDWIYAAAMDSGMKDPFALNVFASSPTDPDRRIYHVFGFEKQGMYAREVARLLLGDLVATNMDRAHEKPGGVIGAIGQWPDGMVMDADEALLAELSNVYGIRVAKAEKKADYKYGAIELCNGDLVDGRLKILKGSTLASQLMQLQWVTDEFGFVKENKAQANHSSDTLIYGRRLLANLFESSGVAPPKPRGASSAPAAPADQPRQDDGGRPKIEDDFEGLLSSGNFDEMWGG